jgi:hypothetical protein
VDCDGYEVRCGETITAMSSASRDQAVYGSRIDRRCPGSSCAVVVLQLSRSWTGRIQAATLGKFRAARGIDQGGLRCHVRPLLKISAVPAMRWKTCC